MTHHFWHPVDALTEEPGGWRLKALDGRTLGLVLASDNRFEVWLRRGDRGEHITTARTLPAAARRFWNAAHPEVRV